MRVLHQAHEAQVVQRPDRVDMAAAQALDHRFLHVRVARHRIEELQVRAPRQQHQHVADMAEVVAEVFAPVRGNQEGFVNPAQP